MACAIRPYRFSFSLKKEAFAAAVRPQAGPWTFIAPTKKEQTHR